MYSCYYILECYNLCSGVEYKIVLFYLCVKVNTRADMHAFWYYIVTETDSILSRNNMFNKMLIDKIGFICP